MKENSYYKFLQPLPYKHCYLTSEKIKNSLRKFKSHRPGTQLAKAPALRRLAKNLRCSDKWARGWESTKAGKAVFHHSLSLGIKQPLQPGPEGEGDREGKGRGERRKQKRRKERKMTLLGFYNKERKKADVVWSKKTPPCTAPVFTSPSSGRSPAPEPPSASS